MRIFAVSNEKTLDAVFMSEMTGHQKNDGKMELKNDFISHWKYKPL